MNMDKMLKFLPDAKAAQGRMSCQEPSEVIQ